MSILTRSKRLFRRLVIALFIALAFFSSDRGVTVAQDPRPLLGARVTNVNATANHTRDLTTPSGVVLSGKIQDADSLPLASGIVLAQSGNQSFVGAITFTGAASSYRVVLPPGTYKLAVQRLVLGENTGTFMFITSDLPGETTIAGNHTVDLVAPALPKLNVVSGKVMSQGALPTRGQMAFSSADGKIIALGLLDETYEVELPAATYEVLALFGENDLGAAGKTILVRLSKITVSGAQTADFTLPKTATLSGTVKRMDGAPAAPSTLFAVDANDLPNLPATTSLPCALPLSLFLLTEGAVEIRQENTTGAYSLPLPMRNYRVAVNLDLDPESEATSVLSFPDPFQAVDLSSDRTQNFTVPPLPAYVMMTGRVTDQNGEPVVGADIMAFTSTITNTPNATFQASTQSGASGKYELKVLSGSDYFIQICPPDPTRRFVADSVGTAIGSVFKSRTSPFGEPSCRIAAMPGGKSVVSSFLAGQAAR